MQLMEFNLLTGSINAEQKALPSPFQQLCTGTAEPAITALFDLRERK